MASPSSPPSLQTLLHFFKVLANESRLKLVGLLSQREHSVEELAALLRLKEPTISHHLAKLKDLDLVYMRAEGNTHFYRLNADTLAQLNKALLTPDRVELLVDEIAPDAWEEKVLRNYFESDRLKEIPASRRKRWVILKWLARQFALDTNYAEPQVNAILQQFHPDSATLRRELVGYRMLQRDRGVYWRLPEADWQEHPAGQTV